jgi:peroxiredoxin
VTSDQIQKQSQTRQRAFQWVMLLAGIMLLLVGAVYGFILVRDGLASIKPVWATPVQVNFPAPELILTDMPGKPVRLSDMRGQVVLLNNWATWCPPCKEEMPELQAYFQAYQGEGFVLVAIAESDTIEAVQAFVQRQTLTFPIWLDPKDLSLAAFGNMSMPNSYVIDRTGAVRLAWTGPINRDILEQYITPILEEK